MSTAQLSPGTIVDGRFTIGAATWARTGAQSYAATDERGQAVVLTAYAPACFSSGLVLERSLRELRQLQTLQSPRVATVHACGKLADGGIYEVVASLPDTRLDALVARGALPGPQAADIIEQVGEGLVEAQKAGVIHRNLGPRVVFVGPAGAVVTGFSVGEPHSDKSFGPLDTIAPEQVEGKVVDQRTLIYNLAALMHMLITGAPLFPGDAAAQLPAHLGGEAPHDVHARLRRALGKDPRMRPMMLKQFLAELRAIGGGAARAPVAPSAGGAKAPPLPGDDLSPGASAAKPAGAPSSRGWTMFMQGEAGAAPAAGAPVAAAPAAAAPTSDVPAKPKTRGWTMFMEGADDEAKPKPEDKPAAQPKTRGWTMFMEDDEGQAAPPPADAQSPVAFEATVIGPAPAPPVAQGAQPRTRGWTMFMEEEEGQAAPAPAPTPAPATAPVPAPAQGVAPPSVGGAAVKPSTRGWTMFMKADEESAAEAVAIADPVAPQPAVSVPPVVGSPVFEETVVAPAPEAPAAAAPESQSRDWSTLDEPSPDVAAEAVAAEAASAEPALAPELESALVAAATTSRRGGDVDAPSKKRGWTMFMEKPLAKQDPLGGVVPASGESNAKGWTVFSPAAGGSEVPLAEPPAESSADGDEPTMAWRQNEPSGPRPVAAAFDVASAQAMAPELDEASSPVPSVAPVQAAGSRLTASGQTSFTPDEADVRAQAAADDERLRVKTFIAGPPDPSLAARAKTIVTPPGSIPSAGPRMVTVLTQDPPLASPMSASPPGAVSSPVATGLSGPISTGMTGPISTSMSGPISTGNTGPISTSMARPTRSDVAPVKKGNPGVLIVVGVLIAAAAIIGAIVLFN